MKKATNIFSSLALTAVLVLSALGQTGRTSATKTATKNNAPSGNTLAQSAKPAKHMAATKSDSDIQSCVESKMAGSSKLKDQGFGVSLSNGVATFTGTTKNSGSKSGVSSIAKTCGTRQVVNNITVEKAAPSATGTTKKSTKSKQ
jgi:osmotically-inducible protein OsmY